MESLSTFSMAKASKNGRMVRVTTATGETAGRTAQAYFTMPMEISILAYLLKTKPMGSVCTLT